VSVVSLFETIVASMPPTVTEVTSERPVPDIIASLPPVSDVSVFVTVRILGSSKGCGLCGGATASAARTRFVRFPAISLLEEKLL
jgi:hypothetical protein